MNILVVHDPLGKEIYINADHVVSVHPTHGDLFPKGAKAFIRLANSEIQAVQETAGAVCYRLQFDLTGSVRTVSHKGEIVA